LAIAVVGILPVIILSRAIAKSRPGGKRDRRPVNTTEDGIPSDDLAVTDQYLPSPAHPIGAATKTTAGMAAHGATVRRQRAS
jgi:hypothetical protein